jgi:hypothetical protein
METEACLIVQFLADHEIDARAVGGFIAGFQAEAPANVAVVVKQCDSDRARKLLAERPVESLSEDEDISAEEE